MKGRFVIMDNSVFNVSTKDETNVALSKNDFATYVYEGKKGFDSFDVLPFVALFDLIRELCTVEQESSLSG